MKENLTFAILTLLCWTIFSCGGKQEEVDCKSAWAKLCTAACDCTEGEACWFSIHPPDYKVIVKLDSAQSCSMLADETCANSANDPKAKLFFQGCNEALKQATCSSTADGKKALLIPGDCR